MGSTAGIMQLVGAGVGAGSTAVGAYSQSQAYTGQGRFARTMGNVNASMADLEAEDAIRRGGVMANRQNMRTALLIGRQRATGAAQGVDVNSGSALDLQANAARMGAIDASTIRMNAYKEAMGIRMKGSNERFMGNMAYSTGRFNANQSLLGGGMSATRQVYSGLDSYYKYQPPMSLGPYLGDSEGFKYNSYGG